MENLQPICKMKYVWKKEWVRPYESIWSVFRNFRIVNSIYSYTELIRILGISKVTNHKLIIDTKLAIYQTIANYDSNINRLKAQLLPDSYMENIQPLAKYLNCEPKALSLKLKYCNKCMNQGYHSYFHQLSGVTNCVFHPEEVLETCYSSSYSIGKDTGFPFDKTDTDFFLKYPSALYKHSCFFDKASIDNGQLPFEWDDLLIDRENIFNELHTDFDEFTAVSSYYISINRESNMGKLLFKRLYYNCPIVKIYDRAFCDKYVMEILIKDNHLSADNYKYSYSLWVFEISNIIKKLIDSYTSDEINLKIYHILSGKQFDQYDTLATNLLFIWKYIGFTTIASSLKFGIDHLNDRQTVYYFGENTSTICILCTNWSKIVESYGIGAACHVIQIHFQYCYNRFLRAIQHECRYRGKFNMESDIYHFFVPTYYIERKGNQVFIY